MYLFYSNVLQLYNVHGGVICCTYCSGSQLPSQGPNHPFYDYLGKSIIKFFQFGPRCRREEAACSIENTAYTEMGKRICWFSASWHNH